MIGDFNLRAAERSKPGKWQPATTSTRRRHVDVGTRLRTMEAGPGEERTGRRATGVTDVWQALLYFLNRKAKRLDRQVLQCLGHHQHSKF